MKISGAVGCYTHIPKLYFRELVIVLVQSYPGYPYLGYPKPRLSERSSERGVCLKKGYFSLNLQSLRLSRVHMFVCHTYMFNVGTQ